MTLDPNRPEIDRPAVDPYPRPAFDDRSRTTWAPLAALGIMALIFGFLFFAPADRTTTTASNEAPISRQTTPTTPTPEPAPAPTKTK